MKRNVRNWQGIITLALLPLVATAAVSAQQWMSDSAPIGAAANRDGIANKTFVSHRMHKIALNQAGAIEGRVANLNSKTGAVEGIANMQVFFIDNGKVVAQSTTRHDGTFLVKDLAEGAYSFVASGPNGFAAYGVKVVAEGAADANNIMEAATVSPGLEAVKQILNQQLPKQVVDQLDQLVEITGDRAVGANRVKIENGVLRGRLSLINGNSVEGTSINLVKDDITIAKVNVDVDGSFSIKNMTPGVYQFVAQGDAGFAAISFEAIDVADATDTDEIAVAVAPMVSDSDFLDVTMAAAQDAMFASDALSFGGFGGDGGFGIGCGIGDSFGCGGGFGGACGACGCGPGGLFGGGGIGGGGGLFGGLGGVGTLGLIGAAIAIPLATSGSRAPASPAE